MGYTVLSYEVVESVAVITMNHPPVNALGIPFLEDFTDVLERLKTEGEVRAVLLTSSCPGVFSAGDDVASLKEIDDELINTLPKAHVLLNELEELPLPTVAGINGHALGGGLELALACDFRFMAQDSGRIGLPEVRLGMIPSIGGTQRLPLVVGKTKAVEMMFKGLMITPEEAKEIGLVNDVFAEGELYNKSFDYALRLSRQATGAIARIKKCMITGIREGFEAGLSMEFETFRANIISPDAKEGIDSFLSGRKPEFKGKD
jgi:enoyl-CoA hydratase/carnithine racemase